MSRLTLLLAALGSALLLGCPAPQPVPSPADGGDAGVTGDAGTDAGTDAGVVDAGPSVGGPLELVVAPSTPVQLAVLWFPSRASEAPLPPGGATSAAPLSPRAERWSLALTEAPPLAARAAVSTPGGGTGSVSWGVMVAFRDVDGDGRLTVAADGTSPDVLLASSAGAAPFDFDGPGVRHVLEWREGQVGSDEGELVEGFNLVRLEGFAAPSPVPLGTDVPLRIDALPRYALSFCPEAYVSDPDELACGLRVYPTPQVLGVAWRLPGFSFTSVGLRAGRRAIANATVTLNDVSLTPDGQGSYVFVESSPAVLRPGTNTLRISAPLHDELVLDFTMPGMIDGLRPLEGAELGAGKAFDVSWAPVSSATQYDVSVTDPTGLTTANVTTSALRVTVDAPTTVGAATIGVVASTPTKRQRHLILGSTLLEQQVSIVP
ncbi:MAG: hypothetical protein ACOZQL_14665 [Myxococcota bacterium]